MSEFKIVSIKDVGLKFEVPGRGVMRGPVERILLNADQCFRLINMHNGPRIVCAVDPKCATREVRLTLENAAMTSEELFPEQVEETVTESKVEVADDSYTLDDIPAPIAEVADFKEPESVEEVTETKSEVTETSEYTADVVTTDVVAEPAVAVVDETKDPEETTADTEVEAPVKVEVKDTPKKEYPKYSYNKHK